MNAPQALQAWKVAEEDFPVFGSTAERLEFLVRYAVLAPSSRNSQPWRFVVRDQSLEMHADRTRHLPIVDPKDRELIMSCGAALFHLRVAMRYFGYTGVIELLPGGASKPDLVARLSLGFSHTTTVRDQLFFKALLKRRTHRLPFKPDPLPQALMDEIRESAEIEGAWLLFLEDEFSRYQLADLIMKGDKQQWGDEYFRKELSFWTSDRRGNRNPGGGFIRDARALTGGWIFRTFDLGQRKATKDWKLAIHSPVLAVLGTNADCTIDWLYAGQALTRVLLRARMEDVSASFLNQPVEVEKLRQRLPRLIGCPEFPQLVLRMGFGNELPPTPRRNLDDVLKRE